MSTEARLERLEKELTAAKRRYRRLTILVVGLAAAGMALAWTWGSTASAQHGGEDIIRAGGFIVEDETGEARAVMGMSRDGPGLHVLDQTGVPRLALDVDEDGPTVYLLDELGVIRVSAVVGDDGPSVQFFDPERNLIWSAP